MSRDWIAIFHLFCASKTPQFTLVEIQVYIVKTEWGAKLPKQRKNTREVDIEGVATAIMLYFEFSICWNVCRKFGRHLCLGVLLQNVHLTPQKDVILLVKVVG